MAENKKLSQTRQELADVFLEALGKKQLPWTQPWVGKTPSPSAIRNAISNRKYSGVNTVFLWIKSIQNGYTDPRWATYQQCKDKGWQVRRGAHGSHVEYWMAYDSKEQKSVSLDEARKISKEDPNRAEDFRIYAKTFTVFNGAQIEGIPELAVAEAGVAPNPEFSNEVAAEFFSRYLTNQGIELFEGGNRAFYDSQADTITLPEKSKFHSEEDYYDTAFHEAIHSTSAVGRKQRDVQYDKEEGRAYEELIAEIGGAFVTMDVFGEVPQNIRDNNVAYVEAWAERIKKDPNVVARAITVADSAANYMMETGELSRIILEKQEEAERAAEAPNKIVARYQSTMNMDDGYINNLVILREEDGFHNHFLYDEDKGKGAAGSGPFATLEEAKQDLLAHYPDAREHLDNQPEQKPEISFDITDFERRIPHKMRYKSADIMQDEGAIYWVTQEIFTLAELKQFQDVLREVGIQKAYVTPRDLSDYEFETDLRHNVLAVVTPEVISSENYVAALKDARLEDYLRDDLFPASFDEFRKVRTNFRTLEELYRESLNEGKTPDNTIQSLADKIGPVAAIQTIANLVSTVHPEDRRVDRASHDWADTVEGAFSCEALNAHDIYQPSSIHPAHIQQLEWAAVKFEKAQKEQEKGSGLTDYMDAHRDGNKGKGPEKDLGPNV